MLHCFKYIMHYICKLIMTDNDTSERLPNVRDLRVSTHEITASMLGK